RHGRGRQHCRHSNRRRRAVRPGRAAGHRGHRIGGSRFRIVLATHFLADLHLTDDHEPFARLLQQYLGGAARAAEAVYVPGALVEVGIGDDGSLPRPRATVDAFAALAATGTPLYFMRGNRDFAVGSAFEHATGMQILDDPHVMTLYGITTLLSHGDVFCTDDIEHQRFRRNYMDPQWRAQKLR